MHKKAPLRWRGMNGGARMIPKNNYNTDAGILEQLKATIGSPAELLQQYFEISPGRGLARCPFHPDKTPSMKVDERRAHCFGCGWSGDSLDIYAKANNLTLQEAIRQLRHQVGVNPDRWREQAAAARRKRKIEEAFKDDAAACFNFLCRKRHQLARLLALMVLALETDEANNHFWAMVEELTLMDEVLELFRENQLQGLRAARRSGLWM